MTKEKQTLEEKVEFEPREIIEVLVNYRVLKGNIFNLEDNKICLGYCDTRRKEIIISPELSLREERLTLIHEILHAMYSIKNIPDTEKEIGKRSIELYKQIYGCKFSKGD